MKHTPSIPKSRLSLLAVALVAATIGGGCAPKPHQPATTEPEAAKAPVVFDTVQQPGLLSIETGYTVSKVRSALKNGEPYIVASSYEGTILGIERSGTLLWKNALSGYMNRDLWCADITGDGSDEILAANADGALYCISDQGNLMWTFKPSDAPMSAVCVVHATNGTPYVVCGGYELKLHYLDAKGKRVKTIDSTAYGK